MDLPGQQQLGQLIADRLLHQPAQRPGSVERIESALSQPLLGRQRNLQFQAALRDMAAAKGEVVRSAVRDD